MSVQAGAGISTQHDPLEAGIEAARIAASGVAGPADLALVFASGTHLAAPEALLEGVHSVISPRVLVGCGAGGVLGAGRELESGSGVAVWAATFGAAGEATPFHATLEDRALEPDLDWLPELSAARPRRASSRLERSVRSEGAASCTGSRRQWPCSPAEPSRRPAPGRD